MDIERRLAEMGLMDSLAEAQCKTREWAAMSEERRQAILNSPAVRLAQELAAEFNGHGSKP